MAKKSLYSRRDWDRLSDPSHFMQPEVTEPTGWWVSDDGDAYPAGDFSALEAAKDCNKPVHFEEKKVGARMSAPGYLDSTEWALFDKVGEAKAYLIDVYGDDE